MNPYFLLHLFLHRKRVVGYRNQSPCQLNFIRPRYQQRLLPLRNSAHSNPSAPARLVLFPRGRPLCEATCQPCYQQATWQIETKQ